jgi:hypothetical protein
MALTIPNTFVNGTPAIATEVNANFTAVKTEVDLKIASTIVDAKGDLIVATAADTVARQAVGSNGQVLVADSGVTNGVAWVDPQTNRNVVINGAMQVAQRGTSVAGITGVGYNTADRYRTVVVNMGAWTQSVEADAPTGSGFRKSLKMLCTTADASPAAADVMVIDQFFEGQNVQRFLKGTASAKPFALSFWVKSNVTGTYIAQLTDLDNTRQVSASYTISASATWEKKTIIFPADTTGVFDNDNAASLAVQFSLGAGTDYTSGTLNTTWASTVNANTAVGQTNLAAATSNYWQITGVQLEAGSVATPFEFEDFSTTLAKCQRYYYRTTADTTFAYLGFGMAGSTTIGKIQITPPVTMRTVPTVLDTPTVSTLRLTDGVTGTTATAIAYDADTANEVITFNVTVASGLTQFRPYFFGANNSAVAYVGFGAEL